MASISTTPDGRRKVQFIAADGSHKTIYLGRATMSQAENIKGHVEKLAGAIANDGPMPNESAKWVAEKITDKLHAKLAAVGLIDQRETKTVKEWLDKYIEIQTAKLKPGSVRKLKQTKEKLLAFFDAGAMMRKINHDQAEDFQTWLGQQGLSEATIKIHAGNVKCIFNAAMRRKLIPENPFENLLSGSTAAANERYITPIESEKILAELVGAEWRLLFGLARYAGLRIPSESHLLTWNDVGFTTGKLNVKSPKTERFKGHDRRTVPITPKLMALLQDRYDAAEPGEGPMTKTGVGPRREAIEAAAIRAGVEKWDNLFQTLRASCEKEWALTFPQYVVSQWIGHSITVSGKHYTNGSVPEELFGQATCCNVHTTEKVTQNTTQQPLEIAENASQMTTTPLDHEIITQDISDSCDSLQNTASQPQMGDEGFEPPSDMRKRRENRGIPKLATQKTTHEPATTDFATAAAGIMALPLTDDEKAAAIRALLGAPSTPRIGRQ